MNSEAQQLRDEMKDLRSALAALTLRLDKIPCTTQSNGCATASSIVRRTFERSAQTDASSPRSPGCPDASGKPTPASTSSELEATARLRMLQMERDQDLHMQRVKTDKLVRRNTELERENQKLLLMVQKYKAAIINAGAQQGPMGQSSSASMDSLSQAGRKSPCNTIPMGATSVRGVPLLDTSASRAKADPTTASQSSGNSSPPSKKMSPTVVKKSNSNFSPQGSDLLPPSLANGTKSKKEGSPPQPPAAAVTASPVRLAHPGSDSNLPSPHPVLANTKPPPSDVQPPAATSSTQQQPERVALPPPLTKTSSSEALKKAVAIQPPAKPPAATPASTESSPTRGMKEAEPSADELWT
eukprot:PhM_4_TR17384/c0_g1_i1/m.32813